MSNAVHEVIWLKMFLREINLLDLLIEPVIINCDNKSAIDFAKIRVENNRTEHIDVAYHFVREQVEAGGMVIVNYVLTNENKADLLTKVLPKVKHVLALESVGLFNVKLY